MAMSKLHAADADFAFLDPRRQATAAARQALTIEVGLRLRECMPDRDDFLLRGEVMAYRVEALIRAILDERRNP